MEDEKIKLTEEDYKKNIELSKKREKQTSIYSFIKYSLGTLIFIIVLFLSSMTRTGIEETFNIESDSFIVSITWLIVFFGLLYSAHKIWDTIDINDVLYQKIVRNKLK